MDIEATFCADVGIQALFISEFGGMCPNIEEEVAGMTKDFFEEVLRDIHLSHLVIVVLPPYVAIVDPTYWQVLNCVRCADLCTAQSNFAMKVFLRHTESGARVGVANCHIPTSTAKK